MNKNWKIASVINQEFQDRFPEIDPLVLQLLWNRGLKNQEKIDEFLLPDYSQDLHDPFLFRDMDKTIERIKKAIERKEKITIYGDYDTDGVCSTTILYLTLKEMGAIVDYYLPDREKEGYGLNKEAAQLIINEGTKLIITVDCGITNVEEVEFIKNLGIEIIITDHHVPLNILPKAFSIINPWVKDDHYPFQDLAGSGVAFKVAQALLKKYPLENKEAFEKWMLDLVAIGSVADMVIMKGENRVLVKYGLIVLNKTSRAGLRQLIKRAKINLGEIDTRSIGIQISSRLNAAGRVDHANLALEMLISENDKKAEELSEKIQKLNELRQKMMEKMFKEAIQEIGDNSSDDILIVYKKNWPVGLLGITAHRLLDIFQRPCLTISIRDHEIKGCGRSIEGFNLIEFLKKFEDQFLRYGGHAGAAGFTLRENNEKFLNEFSKKIKIAAEKELKQIDFHPVIFIEAEVKIEDITWKVYEEILRFEPFGEGNLPPVFLAKNLLIADIRQVGRQKRHLKIIIDNGKSLIYFGGGDKLIKSDVGKRIDIVFEVSDNQWNGTKEMQYKVIDFKKYE
ncbi:MAG: single-stranded-DNA-specific exonuclease RecJ [Ignavibacterium sp.]|nr:single-stranded-DNA-specific exonuclease RecJ [Ignavibacterium sp.]